MARDVFVFEAVRTPRVRKNGKYKDVHPVDLLASCLRSLGERTGIPAGEIGDVAVGCVTQTGEQGWCVGRKGVLAAGWPVTVPAHTVNRLCGSGQQAVASVAQAVAAGEYDLGVGAGVEHMTRVPMFSDGGGEDPPGLLALYPDLVPQGLAAELLAAHAGISREAADGFACESQRRAHAAQSERRFKRSLVPVTVPGPDGAPVVVEADDTIRPGTTREALAALRPAFKPDGIVTAGNASSIVDGAAAVMVGTAARGRELGLRPRARLIATHVVGSPPKIMLTGPVPASAGLLARTGMKASDVDLWEINEAFAPVPLYTIAELGLDPGRVNVNGGGISLGHPLGATGAALIGTAIDELERSGGKFAVVTMCIGLGMGIATLLERCDG